MIVICEPQFWGFQHAQVNAALIGTVADAFQEEELLFFAEAEHIRYVKNILDANSIVVRYREHGDSPPAPSELSADLYRISASAETCFTRHTKNTRTRSYSFSVTSPCLISIKALLRSYRDIVCLVVPHDILQDVTKAPPPLPRFFWFPRWISFGNTHRLRYVVPGHVSRTAQTVRASGEQVRELHRSSLLL